MKKNGLLLGVVFLLTAALLIGPLNSTAHADTFPPGISASSIALGTGSALRAGTTQVAFGGQRWYVVGFNGSGVAKSGAITLLATGVFGTSALNTDSSPNYSGSLLQTAVNALPNAYDSREKAAMVGYTLDGVAGTAPTNQIIWPLSYTEAGLVSPDVRLPSTDVAWWLRTMNGTYYTGYVYNSVINQYSCPIGPSSVYSIRPALAVNLTKVVFAAPISGTKDGSVGTLTQVISSSEIKFTLLDTTNLGLTLTNPPTSTVTKNPGESLSVDYTGAQTGTGKYVSCILVSKTDNMVKYYEKLGTAASGTVSLPITAAVQPGNYTAMFFNEQIVGGDSSDYASTPRTIDLTVTGTANNAPTIKSGVTNPASASVSVNSAYTIDLSTIFTDADGDALSYQVSINSGTAVAANKNYSFTPTSSGSYALKFTANDGIASSATYTVNLSATNVPVTGVTVRAEGGVTCVSRSTSEIQIYADVAPSNATNKALTWTSSVSGGGAYATASIDAANVLRLNSFTANGSITLTATAQDGSGKVGTLTLSVLQYVSTGVTVTSGSSTVAVGGTVQCYSSVSPSNANQSVNWSISSGSSYGSVNSSGVLTATAPGSITVRGTASDGSTQYGEVTITAKATQSAPSAPTISSKNATSVTLNTITGAEYSKDCINWQDSTAFTGLTPNTAYQFYARIKETGTTMASSASSATSVTTDKATLSGTVSISGSLTYGQSVSAVTTSLTSTPSVTLGTLSYQWTRAGSNITGATSASYTVVSADIGKVINVTVTAANCLSSVSSTNAAQTAKATPIYTTPTGLTATYGQTLANVTLTTGFTWEEATSSAVGNAGSATHTVKFTPTDTTNYNVVTGISVTITVGKATPSYTAPTGLTATYGQTLSNVTLTTGFTWEEATSTAVGSVGSRTHTVKFTPTDTANYNTVTGISVTITVGKATPTYTAPTGLTATYGQTLSAVTLTTGFTWEEATSTAVGNAGSASHTVKYTPTDTTNYNVVTGISVTITVGKATPSYTAPTGLTATYGQTLSNVTLTTGFTWEEATSTAVGNVGSRTHTVKFTPTDTANYNAVTGISVTITVSKATPSYTAPTGLTATYGQTLFAVTLTTGFTWEEATSTAVGSVGSRTHTVKYTPTDTTNYNVVTGISVTITVGKATPSYTAPTGLTATYGQTLSAVTLTTGFTWEEATSTAVGNAGSATHTVKFTPADTTNYNVVTGISVTITVGKATPSYTVPTGLTATYGQTLADVALPTGFSWEQSLSNSVGGVGFREFSLTYTPADTGNYSIITNIPVSLTVGKATPTYTVPTGLTATYGQTLADVELTTGFTWEEAASTAVGNAGSPSHTIQFTPADTTNYKVVTSISVTIAVSKATPTYTVPTGLTATYGDTLADVALPTGFSWEAVTTAWVGNAGNRTRTVKFTPADTDNYNTVTGISVIIAVAKATPKYTVPTGLTATYGETLEDVTLPTGFSFEAALTTSVGNAGSRSFTVKYTPTDTANYKVVAGISVTVAVGKATPTYTVPTGLTATYGDTLADVALPEGFSWEAVTTAWVGNAGNRTRTVKYTPDDTDNYNTVTGIPVIIAVAKATPKYAVPTGLTATYGETLEDVTLPTGFSFEAALTTSVGDAGSRSFTVKYTPTDTANYKVVAGISVTVAVGKATPTYTVPTGLTATYGDTLADVALPEGFSWEAATTAWVGNAGNRTRTVKYTPDDTDNYNTVTGIPVIIAVAKATPKYTVPTGLTATLDQTLEDVTLTTGFSWEAALTTPMGAVGSRSFTVKYTPADTANYKTITGISVTIAVYYLPELSGITLSAGSLSPAFSADDTSYTITLKETDTGVKVNPVKAHADAVMTIDGVAAAYKTVTLANGTSKTMVIKIASGKYTRTYTLTIVRPKSTDNYLSALIPTAGTLSPVFTPKTVSYTLTLPEGTATTMITVAKSSPLAALSSASKSFTLANGQTVTATFTVTAQSGAVRTYTIKVTRAKSTNALLATLTSSSTLYPVTPVFVNNILQYTVSLPKSVGSITLNFTAEQSTLAKITVDGVVCANKVVNVESGKSVTVQIVVTAQAGNTKTYTVVVSRK